ncbi:MAG: TauD/TfdA family dioxygenase [Proteobacteria bacterium]|nr:TauD/TfdA family dioxygenase [Pseudomonadota bacterium]
MQDIPFEQAIPAAWYGAELASLEDQWLGHLSQDDVTELETAARGCLALGLEMPRITAEDFLLPGLGRRLALLRATLLHGIGFGVLRGLPVAQYSREMAATIFFGIGAHFGHARSQNAEGHLLGHVRDLGLTSDDKNVRIYQTAERQSFHTDSCDIVGLLCLMDAMEGGETLLVSAVTVFNEILRLRPDLLPYLFEPLATDRRGEVDKGQKPYFRIPVFNWYQGYLSTIYQRQYIDSAQRFPDAPRLTARHIEALDLYDELANDPRLCLRMQLRPGDMQFVYNHTLLHDRTDFRDHPNPTDRRHLLRLWLSSPGDRPLPDCFAERFGSVEIGNRGGIQVSGTQLHAPLD